MMEQLTDKEGSQRGEECMALLAECRKTATEMAERGTPPWRSGRAGHILLDLEQAQVALGSAVYQASSMTDK